MRLDHYSVHCGVHPLPNKFVTFPSLPNQPHTVMIMINRAYVHGAVRGFICRNDCVQR